MFEQQARSRRRTTSSRPRRCRARRRRSRANLPNEFVTNDDFCPGCGLELKSLPASATNLWTDVFQRDLAGRRRSGASEGRRSSPGCWCSAAGARAALSADRRALHRRAARRHQGDAQGACRRSIAYVHGVEDVEKPVEPARSHPRQSVQPRRRSAARISCRSWPTASRRRSRRAAAAWSWPTRS